MAQNTRILIPGGGTWVRLTNANTTGDISIMLANHAPVMLQATSGSTPPTADSLGPLELLSYGDGWSEATIEEKFPGISGADNIWARRSDANIALGGINAIIGISHAA